MLTILYIVLAVIFLFFILQFIMITAAKKSKGTKLNGLSGRLKNLERNGSKGLVYFFSPSCRACKTQTPIIKEMQKSDKNIFDVDISKDMNSAKVFGIKATPTTILVENGVVSQVFVGAKTKDVLMSYLKK